MAAGLSSFERCIPLNPRGRGRWPSSPMEAVMSYVIDQWKLELILALIEATRPILEMVVKWLLGIG